MFPFAYFPQRALFEARFQMWEAERRELIRERDEYKRKLIHERDVNEKKLIHERDVNEKKLIRERDENEKKLIRERDENEKKLAKSEAERTVAFQNYSELTMRMRAQEERLKQHIEDMSRKFSAL